MEDYERDEVRDFVRNVLTNNLEDARNQFKDLLAQKAKEREDELYDEADFEWEEGEIR